MNAQRQHNLEDTIDLQELFFSLLAQWKLITLCILISAAAALLYLRVTPDTYSVDALVQVEDKKGSSAALLGQELSGLMDSAGLGGKQVTQAEIEILKSRLILGSTIQQLNLDTQISPTQNSLWTRLLAPIHFETNYSNQGIAVTDTTETFDIQQFDVPKKYLDEILILTFQQQGFTLIDQKNDAIIFSGKLNQNNILSSANGSWRITIHSPAPLDKSYFIQKQSLPTAVNNILANYSAVEKGKLTGVLGLTYQGTDKVHITKVLNLILTTYQQQNVQQNSQEKEQTLAFLNKQLPKLKTELDQAERQFNNFRQQYNTVDVSKESELYLTQSKELETQKIQLEQKQAELAAQYTTKHPLMLEVVAQLETIEKKINELNKVLQKIPDIQRQFLQFYRDVEVKTQLYTNLLNTYQTLSVAKAGEIGNIRIVDYAIEPIEPIKPQKLLILALSLFIGTFIGVLIALLLKIMRSGVRDSAQIESSLGLAVYGLIPRSIYQPSNIRKRAHLPILAVTHSDDISIESLRSVRTTLLFTLAQAKHNVLLFTSSAPEAGKSFISTNIAALLAQNNKKVLLIDADLRRGYLHKYFKDNNQIGLGDILTDTASSQNAIHSSDVKGLYYLSRGQHPTHPSELLNSDKFTVLIEQLRKQYDYIVMDSPPILAVTDGLIIAKYAGVNVLVARYAETQLKEIEMVIGRFDNIGCQLNGVILNNVNLEQRDYKYGYKYAYNYRPNDTKN